VTLSELRIAVQTDNGIAPPTEATRAAVAVASRMLEQAGAWVGKTDLPPGGHELTHEVWRSYAGEMRTAELYSIMRRWDLYRIEVMIFFQSFDAILCPVFDTSAPEHGRIETNGEGVSYTTPFSLTDSPSVVVRAGTSDEGLPIGVQIVAAPWRDEVALAVAGHLELELGGWSPPPSLRESL
jgi:amidase